MHVLEVGIDLLQVAKNAMVSRVGVISSNNRVCGKDPEAAIEQQNPWGSGPTLIHKAALCLIRYEMSIRAFLEDHVSPLPWLVVDQTPLMA